VGDGEPCDDADCMYDLECDSDSHRCERYLLAGEACSRNTDVGGRGCIRGTFCVFPTPDAPDGVCTLSPPFTGPTPCNLFSDYPYCPFETTYRDTHGEETSGGKTPKYCNCLPLITPGGACTSDDQCEAQRCIDGTCRARLPNGESCSEDNDCTSLHCVLGACSEAQRAGRRCKVDADCVSGHCDATEHCQGPDDACAP
jgi:hypothetical protein